MNITWKKTFKSMIIVLILLLISTILINTLYYFDVISAELTKYFKLIFSIFSFFIGGFYMGKNSPDKGYKYGLRLSLLIVIFFIIMGIIMNNLEVSRIIFYLITIFCITFGSMIGINKKTK